MDEYPIKWINPFLAAGYAPRCVEHIETLRTGRVRAIVNLCAECYDLDEIEKASGFEVYFLPVSDEQAPDLDGLIQCVDWMDQQIKIKHPVLVHCRYGIGRTGTVVLAYLMHQGHEFQSARKMMRPTPCWPSTRAQKDIVDQYIIRLRGTSIKDQFSPSKPGFIGKYFERLKASLKWDD